MAVKVRCPTCEKVLNAPDAARGKAVKCPDCDTKVKVPAGDGGGSASPARSVKKPASKAVDSDENSFLDDLDLDKVADSSHAMCPKCGASLPEDATECPKCGVDPETGQLSARAKKRKGMKGPDPALFYKLAWTDSWAFMLLNWPVAVRTGVYFTLLQLTIGLCSFMIGWCSTIPPKVFFLSVGLGLEVSLLGWPWAMAVETIRTTVARKNDIRRIHFEMFTNIALGLKLLIWSVVFWLYFPPALLAYPVAMIHMAMPVTKLAWFNLSMLKVMLKNFSAVAMYWLIVFCWVLGYFVFSGLGYFAIALIFGAERLRPEFMEKPTLDVKLWVMLAMMILLGACQNLLLGFFFTFWSRVLGLMAYYFKDTLDLVVIVAEKEYKRKEFKVDVWGNPIKSTEQKILEIALIPIILGILGGLGYWIYVLFFKQG
jgi:ribosomal protein L40E